MGKVEVRHHLLWSHFFRVILKRCYLKILWNYRVNVKKIKPTYFLKSIIWNQIIKMSDSFKYEQHDLQYKAILNMNRTGSVQSKSASNVTQMIILTVLTGASNIRAVRQHFHFSRSQSVGSLMNVSRCVSVQTKHSGWEKLPDRFRRGRKNNCLNTDSHDEASNATYVKKNPFIGFVGSLITNRSQSFEPEICG